VSEDDRAPLDGRGEKEPPERLSLRARPRGVARFNRRVVIGVAATGCTFIVVATMAALHPASFHRDQSGELLIGANKQVADQLAGLPKSYGDLAPKPPKLGPPLPGDLGPAVAHQEQTLGLRPNPEEDADRAERMRIARQTQQARASTVFFQVSVRPPEPVVAKAAQVPAQVAGIPADAAKLDLDPERDPNGQQRKLSFLNGKQDERSIYNPHVLQHPVSPYQVMAGTIIAASLITGINSDLPGLVIAQVTEDVWDSVTGRILLIPQGSRLVGTYDPVVAFGQSRALLVWQRIIMPNGYSMVIDNLPATDTAGYAGLEDDVDFHTWQLLKGVALSTLLGTGTQVTFGSSQSNLVQAIRQSTQESTNEAGQRLVEKSMNVQPTITVRPGWPVRAIFNKDLILKAYGQEDGQSLPNSGCRRCLIE
jgi:type IV secretion system protein VirB10